MKLSGRLERIILGQGKKKLNNVIYYNFKHKIYKKMLY